MARLKNRNSNVLGNFKFLQPQVKFEAEKHTNQPWNFWAMIDAIKAHRKANGFLVEYRKLATPKKDHYGQTCKSKR